MNVDKNIVYRSAVDFTVTARSNNMNRIFEQSENVERFALARTIS